MKRRLLLTGMAGSAALALAGCAGPQISDYAAEKPVLDLREYFNGTLDAYGLFTDRSGKVVKRFTVVMRCTWTGDEGVLDEDFTLLRRHPAKAHLAPEATARRPLHRHRGRRGRRGAGPAARQRLQLDLHAGAAGGWHGLERRSSTTGCT